MLLTDDEYKKLGKKVGELIEYYEFYKTKDFTLYKGKLNYDKRINLFIKDVLDFSESLNNKDMWISSVASRLGESDHQINTLITYHHLGTKDVNGRIIISPEEEITLKEIIEKRRTKNK